MKIKKFGQCCLLITTNDVTILTDPGSFSSTQNEATGIDVVLITHEHADHLHIESLGAILKNNPGARVITNSAVGKKLTEAGIAFEVVEGRGKVTVKNIEIEAFDGKHEEIYEDYGQVQNTGYFIDNKLFYPGDSFFDPKKPVAVLALPVAGPWCRLADVIRYALRVRPAKAFPVHDAALSRGGGIALIYRIAGQVLKENKIDFVPMEEGSEAEF